MNLRERILDVLAGSTSQKPVELHLFYRLGKTEDVQRTLLTLYHAQEVQTCSVTKQGTERSLWWIIGTPLALPVYGYVMPGFKRHERGTST